MVTVTWATYGCPVPYGASGGDGVQLYMEGNKRLRAPISQFIRKITGPIDLKITPCNSRDDAIKQCMKDEGAMLLIDSEGEELRSLISRTHSQIGPANRAFFMVQKMESWFIADQQSLSGYFGPGFRENALPQNPNVEEVPTRDIDDALRNATRNCSKQRYVKGRDDVGLLNRLNPTAVYSACPNFARLIDFLRGDAGVNR